MTAPARAWLLPRLTELLHEAGQADIPQDVAVAVLADLITGPQFNPGSTADIDENWAQDIGEPASMSSEMPAIDTSSPVIIAGEGVGVSQPRLNYRNTF